MADIKHIAGNVFDVLLISSRLGYAADWPTMLEDVATVIDALKVQNAIYAYKS